MLRKLALLILAPYALAKPNDFLIAELSSYFDVTGPPHVSGTVVVTEGVNSEKNETLTLSYKFETSHALGNTSGGIHIYKGTSCGTNSGRLYFDGSVTNAASSWLTSEWTTKDPSTTTYEGVTAAVYSGYSVDENVGKIVVVRDSNGTKIACGKLTDGQRHFAKIGNYPAYTPTSDANTPRGLVYVNKATGDDAVDGEVTMDYHLLGFTPSQSSGLHIHVGMDCWTDPGGHYWNETEIKTDPWTTNYTATDSNGFVDNTFNLNSGWDWPANVGRTVVAYDGTNKRGCGVIGSVANMRKYPGYAGDIRVKGQARVTPKNETENTISFTFTGLPRRTRDYQVHIHTGTSCATDDAVGGNYYSGANDTWTPTASKVTSDRNGVAIGSFDLNYGISLKDSMGHVMVVYADEGTKVACGVLSGVLAPAPAPTTAAATPTTAAAAPTTAAAAPTTAAAAPTTAAAAPTTAAAAPTTAAAAPTAAPTTGGGDLNGASSPAMPVVSLLVGVVACLL